jgi:hypothetical protein
MSEGSILEASRPPMSLQKPPEPLGGIEIAGVVLSLRSFI